MESMGEPVYHRSHSARCNSRWSLSIPSLRRPLRCSRSSQDRRSRRSGNMAHRRLPRIPDTGTTRGSSHIPLLPAPRSSPTSTVPRIQQHLRMAPPSTHEHRGCRSNIDHDERRMASWRADIHSTATDQPEPHPRTDQRPSPCTDTQWLSTLHSGLRCHRDPRRHRGRTRLRDRVEKSVQTDDPNGRAVAREGSDPGLAGTSLTAS